MVAEGLLARLGYDVESAVDGVEAIEAFKRTHFSAILMDCHMPVMDGFTATAEIRNLEPYGSRIPIIAMTAGARAEDRDRCLAAGMDDHIAKPVNAQVLADALASWIRRGRSEPKPPSDRMTGGEGGETTDVLESAISS